MYDIPSMSENQEGVSELLINDSNAAAFFDNPNILDNDTPFNDEAQNTIKPNETSLQDHYMEKSSEVVEEDDSMLGALAKMSRTPSMKTRQSVQQDAVHMQASQLKNQVIKEVVYGEDEYASEDESDSDYGSEKDSDDDDGGDGKGKKKGEAEGKQKQDEEKAGAEESSDAATKPDEGPQDFTEKPGY